MRTKILLLILGIVSLLSLKAKGQSMINAKEILSKTDQITSSIKDRSAEIKMVMVKLKRDKEKIKKAILFQKGADRKLFRYIYPKADSGIVFLSLPNHQIYIYLSLFKKAKRITNLANSMYNNSDFSFQDMSTKSYSAEYIPELLKSNDSTYLLKLIPKNQETNYKYVIATINKHFFYPEQLSYFNQKGKKIKQAKYHFIRLKGIWIAREVDMTDFEKKHMTKIIMSNIKINTGLKDEIFTVRNLENKP